MSNGDSLIGIIGAGPLGQALARHAAGAGVHAVLCNSRGPASLAELVATMGPNVSAGTLGQAAQPEIVIIAIPWGRLGDAFTEIPDWEGRIVVDATNPASLREIEASGGRGSSEILADRLTGAHVVKAFNTLPAAVLDRAAMEIGGKRVIFLSGDHPRARATVARLIDRMGFMAIDLGSLEVGSRLMSSPGGPLAQVNLVSID